ncbi:hypothetical protein [Nocardia sp. NPDC005366]|uniref:hypothetical protein n=1 Tax=Nocardia sp. NPDC005366 TaxID=3156878 RepID=UPI0033A5D999
MEERIATCGIEPGQWLDVEWPPTGGMSDEGHVHWTEFEPCEKHYETYDESGDESAFGDCESCRQRERVVDKAKWTFHTTVRTNRIYFDGAGHERDREEDSDAGVEVAVIEQDPEDILIGPSGEGRYW